MDPRNNHSLAESPSGGKRRESRRRAGRKEQKKKVPIGIFNISGQELNNEEIRVLDKSLKYAPVKNPNKFDTSVQIQKCMRTLNQNKYFLSKPDIRPPSEGGRMLLYFEKQISF